MTAPIPPVTPAHAEGITATEQDQARAEGAAVRAVLAHRWADGPPWHAHAAHTTNSECAVCCRDVSAVVAVALAAAALIIAAATGERIAQAIEAYQPKAHPVSCPPAIAFEAARETFAAIARAGTSEADRG